MPIYNTPGISLRIEDRLYNRTRSHWLSNLHFAAGFVPDVDGPGFTARVGERIVRAEFKRVGRELILTVGDTEPYQG